MKKILKEIWGWIRFCVHTEDLIEAIITLFKGVKVPYTVLPPTY